MSPPDVLYGYKVWRTDGEGNLYSLRVPATHPWLAWSPDRPMVATCVRGFLPWGEHRAPVRKCSCGIYAFANPQPLKDPDLNHVHYFDPIVWGVVQLWGHVVEHWDEAKGQHGYRAERARLVALEHSEHARAVAKRYNAIILGDLKEWGGEE